MNYCQMAIYVGSEIGGYCDAPASTKIERHWYCEKHADMLYEFFAGCGSYSALSGVSTR